jgi:chaperonin GroEL
MKKISILNNLLSLLQTVAQSGTPLVLIAEDVEGNALIAIIVNQLCGRLNVWAVKTSGLGNRRKAMLEDIAILIGGIFISKDLSITLENITIGDLGGVKHITISKKDTTIVEGNGRHGDIQAGMK